MAGLACVTQAGSMCPERKITYSMIRHLLTLIWNQRRQNGWIAIELFFVFIFSWYIVDYFITLGYITTIDEGFTIEDTYQVRLATIPETSPRHTAAYADPEVAGENFLTIVDRIRHYPDVQQVSVSSMSVPYSPSYHSDIFRLDTQRIPAHILQVTPAFFSVFHIRPADGSEPNRLAAALKANTCIISPEAVPLSIPPTAAVGKTLFYSPGEDSIALQISAVCTPLKRHEYSRLEPVVILPLTDAEISRMNESILSGLEISIRVTPGLPEKAFREKFKQDMRSQCAVGNFVLANVAPGAELRSMTFKLFGFTDGIRYRTAFMLFFLFNIFLGIIGIFWFRNEYRKPEIGLRMAAGSSRSRILSLMMTESWLLLSLAALPAALICLNAAHLEIIDTEIMDITFPRLAAGLTVTYLLMAAIVLLATWYPAWLSSRIAPAETLRNE